MKKKLLRILLSFSVVLTLMLAMSMTVMAATDEVEGIQAEQTVDTSSGNIEVTLKVTAEEGYSIEGVTLKNQKPDGYKLLSGEAEMSEETIQSGNSKSLKTVFTKETEAVNTGDSNSTSILLFGGLAILSAALIIFLLTRSKKGRNKMFTLFICGVLVAASAITFAGKSYAYESEGKQIEFSKEVTIGKEKVTVNSVVSYDRVVEDTYNVTVQVQDDQGTATVKVGDADPTSENTKAAKGANLVFTAAPKDGYEFDYWEVVFGGIDIEAIKTNNPIELTMPETALTLKAYFKTSQCIAAGTMISMPEGKQKAVEELEIGDVICTFDHVTGEESSAPVCFIWESKNVGNAFTLTFEDDIEVTVIEEHGFYDQEEQKYAFINLQNAKEYIGHHFYNADSNSWLELKSCEVLNDRIDAYAIITSGDLNHMSNGMLSMCDGTVKVLANLFEYDDQMKFDEEEKQADIDEYGLMTKEKILELDGFIESDYDDYNLQYLNVAIGKGLITWEWLEAFSDYCVANGL